MTATQSTKLTQAFHECGLNPVLKTDDSNYDRDYLAQVTIKGETYWGSSTQGHEHALKDLLSDMPEDHALRVQRKAGLLA